MNNRIVIITEHNLVKYPPMQSFLQVLVELGRKVCFIGYCSDTQMQKRYARQGVAFCELCHSVGVGLISKLITNKLYRKHLRSIMESLKISSNDLIIYDYTSSAYYIHDLLMPCRYIVLFYEFINPSRSWKYDLLYRTYNLQTFLHNSVGVIHCEYNRAQITKGLYNLKKLPYILPNKPYIDDTLLLEEIPDSIKTIINKFDDQTTGKKIILYQGIFNSHERRLEEFCEAIELLPDDFVLVAMGGGDMYYEHLKSKYESDRIIFLPFVTPPYHLLVTQLAYIGVLSYFPLNNTYAGVINPLYCAPNKIFEYSKFSIPMISNDIPGLKRVFGEYHCGEVVCDPFTPEHIMISIQKIHQEYKSYSEGSQKYYNSVDFKEIVKSILLDVEEN